MRLPENRLLQPHSVLLSMRARQLFGSEFDNVRRDGAIRVHFHLLGSIAI
jgi:hypothetical protein